MGKMHQDSNASSLRKKIWLISCVLAFFSSMLCFVTLLPMVPVDELDPSWKAGMSYAVNHGLRIGTDVIFTFGPLANVYTGFYSPEYDAGYVLISTYIAISFFIGVYSLFYRRERFVPMLVCAGVVFFWGFKKDAFMMILPFFLIFMLVFEGLPNERRTKLEDVLFLILLPVIGLLPLIKLSVIVACVVCIGLSALLLAYRRRLLMAGATCLIPLLSCFSVWIAFGQEPGSLLNYFSSSLPIIAGYTEAMAIYKGPLFVVVYLIGAAALLYGVWSVKRNSSILTAITVLLLAIYLFLNFKAGFVRDDTHAMISGVAIMLISLMVWPALQSLRGLGFTCVGFLAGLVVACANISFSPVRHWDLAYGRAYESIKGLTLRIGYPGALAERLNEQMAKLSVVSGFPSVSGTTDVYSYGQTALIASGANWSPRPVFQSYSAYTPKLLELNADHLKSKRAPENIIFRIQPIDGRLPSLEDGLSWPSIFAMYSPVRLSGEYLVLKRVKNTAPVFNEIKTEVGGFDNSIEVPSYSGGLYMTVDIQQTLLGRLISTLFKPSYLIARFTLANGEAREYRVISSMIKTKFLVSPLVENNKDFLSLFSDADLNQAGKVKSIVFSASESENVIWKPNFKISFYSFQPPARDAAAALLGIALPAKVGNPPSIACTGVVDYLNSNPITDRVSRVGKYLAVRGWVTPSVKFYPEGGRAVLLLKGAQGDFAFDMQSSVRPDLAKHFESPSMLNAGYDATLDMRELEGDFEVGLGFVRDGAVSRCNGLDSIAKITR
jgi:hypothetical protein